ncbi:U32 family peptidase [Methanomassiliicoccus luminyensis]|uniref:U32 family peptidase n=1 Tax=Methanomassiliicoccus luminyensis TaxID=1080712 RepID=UPI00035EEEA4|nr:U32 family peptidase [Methanomassiliicoccus luminyensis]
MEVLSPAGSKDAFKAALEGGADAVYLGGKTFGARKFAPNFSDAELKCAIKLAHSRNAKVYVTVNTLVKDRELGQAFSYLDLLNSIETDAVIVQDRGLLRMIRDSFKIPVHGSTQMGIHSPDDARWAKENGLERAILSRELSLDEVERVRKASDIGIEVFIHGALCYCFSGQCLFSSILGGRSGNRGMCAQPCRKRYALGREQGYMLSTADLFSVQALPRLMEMGVDAIKIEGRLRSPAYVYLATRTYKSAVERAARGEEELITPREREMLEVAFNRGFSPGYLMTNDVMQRDYAESRGLSLGKATVRGKEVTIRSALLEAGDGITFYRGAEKVGGFEVKDPQKANGTTVVKSPFRLEIGEYSVYKTKDREFPGIERTLSSVEFPTCQAQRRSLPFDLPRVSRGRRREELSFYVSSLKTLDAVLRYADRVYYDGPEFEGALSRCDASKVECVLMMPRVTPEVPEAEASSIMVNSVGQYQNYKDRRLYGSYFMNLFNSLAMPDLYQYTLSVELSREEMRELCSHYRGRLEALVFGRIELMVTRDPSLNEGTLIDERGKRFPVSRDRCGYAHIMNSSDLFLLDFMEEMDSMGIDSYGIDLRGRPTELCSLVAKAFRERDPRAKDRIRRRGSITAGHYLRGVE